MGERAHAAPQHRGAAADTLESAEAAARHSGALWPRPTPPARPLPAFLPPAPLSACAHPSPHSAPTTPSRASLHAPSLRGTEAQGGRATFEAIVEALRSNCPVVVVRESGGAAELVARFLDTLRPQHRNALTQQNPLCAPPACEARTPRESGPKGERGQGRAGPRSRSSAEDGLRGWGQDGGAAAQRVPSYRRAVSSRGSSRPS